MPIETPEQWARLRERGRARFLLLHGVLGRGLPMGLLIAVVVEIATGRPLPDSLLSARFALVTLAAVALFSLSGCIRADARWRMAERRFG